MAKDERTVEEQVERKFPHSRTPRENLPTEQEMAAATAGGWRDRTPPSSGRLTIEDVPESQRQFLPTEEEKSLARWNRKERITDLGWRYGKGKMMMPPDEDFPEDGPWEKRYLTPEQMRMTPQELEAEKQREERESKMKSYLEKRFEQIAETDEGWGGARAKYLNDIALQKKRRELELDEEFEIKAEERKKVQVAEDFKHLRPLVEPILEKLGLPALGPDEVMTAAQVSQLNTLAKTLDSLGDDDEVEFDAEAFEAAKTTLLESAGVAGNSLAETAIRQSVNPAELRDAALRIADDVLGVRAESRRDEAQVLREEQFKWARQLATARLEAMIPERGKALRAKFLTQYNRLVAKDGKYAVDGLSARDWVDKQIAIASPADLEAQADAWIRAHLPSAGGAAGSGGGSGVAPATDAELEDLRAQALAGDADAQALLDAIEGSK